VLSLALCSSYSYSSADPFKYGASGNAARNALSWGMSSVFPPIGGIDINGLIYRYSTIKETDADMKVTIGNLNAEGDGYTFKETDDWSGVPSNTITKSFPLSNIPLESWGDGSITVEGEGTVKDATVIYTFRVDECYDPQLNPSCAGYVKPIPKLPVVEVYNALEDDSVINAIENENFEYEETAEIPDEDEDDDKPTKLELGLMSSQNALTMFKEYEQGEMINIINLQTNIQTYYNSSINGGIYEDKYKLSDEQMPDNKRALRANLAQQLKHEEMVNMQYK
tara:strand:- start:2012 stop:2854 length:843 start_codon:yes stop_codon:yes gene_type:complete